MPIKNRVFLLLAVVVTLGVFLLSGKSHSFRAHAQITPAPARPGRSLLDKKLVWAHCLVSYPLDLTVLYPYKPHGYSEMYPLYQEERLEQRTGRRWQAVDIDAAKAAGVDGFSLDIFNQSADAVPSLEAADKSGGFLIAPCLDLSTSSSKEADAFKTIDDYCRLAGLHPSAARINGDFLIFTYGTEQLSVAAWRRVRARLAAAGDKTYWVVSVDTDGKLGRAKTFPAAAISQYFDVFEAGYCFTSSETWWNDLVTLFQDAHRPFMGGMMPGYYRTGAGDWDAEGTATYRRQWQKHLSGSVPWAMISTWNDFQENTELTPSSDWNFSRAELTLWYSEKFKGAPEPWTAPQLYVTTPKTGYPGQKARAEALVLNPLPHAVTALIRFFDAEKKPVGAPVTVSIPAGDAQAATQFVNLSAFPPGSFLRAQAEVTDQGKVIASVVSAPILVLDPQAQPGFPTLYYSIPASHALPETVSLKHEGGEVTYAFPAAVHRRFAEVLHNTALVKNDLRGRTVSLSLPAQPDYGSPVQVTTWGFDVARVTDDHFRVGYSDPLYIAPPRSVALKEQYDFDEGQGSEITDRSSYHQASRSADIGWSKPGFSGSPACAYFNGHTSRIDLTVGQTPVGPVSWRLAVRPSAFGSVLYADVGGFIVSLTKDGKVNFTRHTSSEFVTAYGATPLLIGAWSQIQCTWDGRTSRVYVNGHLDGQTPCEGGFESSRRSLGCNPFGQSSDYYNGDMDNFEISTLPLSSKL